MDIDTLKLELDKQLAFADANVGIAFGSELFSEFKRRDWLTLESFGSLGSSLFSTQLPAYNKTHFAFISWGIGEHTFQVGQSNKA
jgi:hypothetical protein